jgi:transcriptional regulator with XRE-family HTH domain
MHRVVRQGNRGYNPGNMDAEVQRLIHLLRTMMRLLGFTNRDIERKLGLSPSYLSRLYSGGIELKAEHLVHIPKAMGLEPEEFFHLAYPRRVKQGSRAATQLAELIRDLGPPPEKAPAPGFTDEQKAQLKEMMQNWLRQEPESNS